MLVELRVQDLGVIADLSLVVGPAMTVLTGETGAGKTLVVEALELLLGGRADPSIVRAGAPEAVVEGRFVSGDEELVMRRVVPSSGRSRAYADGRMVPVSTLVELGEGLVDLYGQHAHQSLLRQSAQREALDRFAGVDLRPVLEARQALAAIARELEALGGEPRERARRTEVLRYQLAEIEAAQVADPAEEEALVAEEEVLTDVESARGALRDGRAALAGSETAPIAEVGALELLGRTARLVGTTAGSGDLVERVDSARADLEDVADELRRREADLEDDPARLEAVRRRRSALADLRRKYGPSLGEVIAFAESCRAELESLGRSEELQAALDLRRQEVSSALAVAEEVVGSARREAAPRLSEAIWAHLVRLGLPRAHLEVKVGSDRSGSAVEVLFGANRGEPALPLAKVVSGGELARAMLAVRMVLTAAPPTLVFDEVDAGIGGEAALAVGGALAELARTHQVLVVTHLAQVAAFADHHVVVTKTEEGARTVARATPVGANDRVVELSRMLSGHPDLETARRHAKELLAMGARSAGPGGASGSLDRYRDGRSA